MKNNHVNAAVKKRRFARPLLLFVLLMGSAWLLKTRIISLVAGLILGIGLSTTSSVAGGEDGFPMLVEALRNSGRNPAIIHTGRIEALRRHTNQEISEADFQKQLADYKRQLEDRLALFSKNNDVDNRNFTLKAIKDAESDRRKVLKSMSDKTEKYEITFRGVDPFTDVKQRIMSAEAGAGQDSEVLLAIGSNLNPMSNTYLRKDSYSSLIRVDRSYGAFPFNEFGRARGATLQFLTATLLLGTTDARDDRFNQATIEKTRGVLKAIGSGYPIQKQVEFEGGTASVVEISARLDKAPINPFGVGRTLVWIDPARGYICPKIEEYVGDRVFKSYESSGYFLDQNSGLWWPRSHIETEYDPDTGAIKSRDTYTMTPEGTALNIPIDDDEFVFHAKPGMQIADNQEGTGPIYHVANETSLRMKNGVLDFSHNPDLILQDRLQNGYTATPFKAMNSGSRNLFVIITANIAVITLVSIYMRWRKSVSRPA